jgi:hypothetical protein
VVHKDICLLQEVFRIRHNLHLHQSSQKKSQRSHKTVGNKGFITKYFCLMNDDRRIRIRIRIVHLTKDLDLGGPNTYGS